MSLVEEEEEECERDHRHGSRLGRKTKWKRRVHLWRREVRWKLIRMVIARNQEQHMDRLLLLLLLVGMCASG